MSDHDLTEWELREYASENTHVTATMWRDGNVTFHRTTECGGSGLLFAEQFPVPVEYMARQFVLDQEHDCEGVVRNHNYCGRCIVQRSLHSE